MLLFFTVFYKNMKFPDQACLSLTVYGLELKFCLSRCKIWSNATMGVGSLQTWYKYSR